MLLFVYTLFWKKFFVTKLFGHKAVSMLNFSYIDIIFL